MSPGGQGGGRFRDLMIPAKVFHFREPAAAIIGFQELAKRGITPRSILFIALDTRGECHVAIPQASARVGELRVGDKMSCETPWEGRYYHFDAIHRLPGDTVLWNGDRRLDDTGSAAEIAYGVSRWLRQLGAKDMFLGCTPHQPGSWWISDERAPVADLHASGLVDAVVTQSGLLARRIGEPGLFHLDFADLRSHGIRGNWTEVYRSDLGNILMLERRVINYSLVLSCERGRTSDSASCPPLWRKTSELVLRQRLEFQDDLSCLEVVAIVRHDTKHFGAIWQPFAAIRNATEGLHDLK